MKKILIGFVAGAVLMFSAQAFGDGISLTGKKVEGQAVVTLNDKLIGRAIIVDGKSFVPVRDITNGFGGKVDRVDTGVIALSSPYIETTPPTTRSAQINDVLAQYEKQYKKVGDLMVNIANAEFEIVRLQKQVDESKAAGGGYLLDSTGIIASRSLQSYNEELPKQKNILTYEEAKLTGLSSQLKAIQE